MEEAISEDGAEEEAELGSTKQLYNATNVTTLNIFSMNV